MHYPQHRFLKFTGGVLTIFWSLLPAQSADAPLRKRAMDLLILDDDTRLLGVLLNPQEDSDHRVLLQADWLQSHQPELFEQVTKAADAATADPSALITRLQTHLQTLRQQTPADLERIGWLGERLKNLEPQPTVDNTPDVIVLGVPANRVRRKLLQKPDIREIGRIAILNRVPEAEVLSARDLAAELHLRATKSELRTTLSGTPDDVAKDEQRFLSILMSAEYLLGNRCRLICHAGRYFPADQPSFNPTELLPNLLQSELQTQLVDLLSEPSVLGAKPKTADGASSKLAQILEPAAAVIAAQQNANLVQVTRMRVDSARATAHVQIDIFFRAPDDTVWKRVGRVSGSATGKDVTAEAKQQIANDPRVTQVTNLFAGFGADAGSLSTALTVGAVVQAAQSKAQQRLADHLSSSSTSTVAFQVVKARLPE